MSLNLPKLLYGVTMEHKLFLRLQKCEFHRKQIEYLGLVVSENKVAMDPVKVAGVCEWPVPENWTDVQAFCQRRAERERSDSGVEEG